MFCFFISPERRLTLIKEVNSIHGFRAYDRNTKNWERRTFPVSRLVDSSSAPTSTPVWSAPLHIIGLNLCKIQGPTPVKIRSRLRSPDLNISHEPALAENAAKRPAADLFKTIQFKVSLKAQSNWACICDKTRPKKISPVGMTTKKGQVWKSLRACVLIRSIET